MPRQLARSCYEIIGLMNQHMLAYNMKYVESEQCFLQALELIYMNMSSV